jgi:lysophospholipase L1-like esterase
MKKYFPVSLILNILLIALLLAFIHLFGGWRYVLYRIQSDGGGTYQHRVELFEDLSAKQKPGAILVVGDSEVEQGEWRELFGDSLDIRNRGIVGDGSQGILRRIDTLLATKPSEIWLWFGVNDLIFGNSVEASAGGYDQVLAHIFSKKNPPIVRVLSVMPTNSEVKKVPVENENIQRLNEKLQILAEKYKISFLDLNPIMADEKGRLRSDFTSDGLHLNGKGYKKLVDLLKVPRSSASE